MNEVNIINVLSIMFLLIWFSKIPQFNYQCICYPHLDSDVPLTASYGVYLSQLVRFARVCYNVNDFNERNISITAKLLHQGFRYHRLLKTFTDLVNFIIDIKI